MLKRSALCMFFLLTLFRIAQPSIQWQQCLGGSEGDKAYSIQQTSDGGFIVAGKAYSNDGDVNGNHGKDDVWVVKLDSRGEIEWQRCLGGSDWDEANSIQQTSDGGFIVAGVTESNDGDVSGWHEGYDDEGNSLADCWVVKLNSTGAIEWQRCLGGSKDDKAFSIQQTSDGGFIVAGETWSNDGDVSGNHGGRDAWVVKLDPRGAIEWQRCLGGSEDDAAYSIQQTSDGGFIVAGRSCSKDGDVSGNHGWYDAWVVKLDSRGAIEWQRCLGGSKYDEAESIQQTSDGGFIVAGRTGSNNGDVSGLHGGWLDSDAWVVKLDPRGAIQWQRCLGGTGEDGAESVQQTSDGGFIVAGWTGSNNGDVSGRHFTDLGPLLDLAFINAYDCWVVKLNSSGAIEWQRCLGGGKYDEAYSIQQTVDGGFIVAGWTESNDGDVSRNHGKGDVWIIKLSPER